MTLALPTAKEMRKRDVEERKRQILEDSADSKHAAWLLWAKGDGRMYKLKLEEQKFIRRVMRKSYYKYLESVRLGKPKPNGGSFGTAHYKPRTTIGTHMRYNLWRRRWWGCSRTNYRRWFIPKQAKARLEAARNGHGDPALSEFTPW